MTGPQHKKGEYCGECIFCTSKCPQCGSTEVEVRMTATYYYQNDMEDEIDITLEETTLYLDCQDCGEQFTGDDLDGKLEAALEETLSLPTGTTATYDSGKVGIQSERYELIRIDGEVTPQ